MVRRINIVTVTFVILLLLQSCSYSQKNSDEWTKQREKLVNQLKLDGITDQRTLTAMNQVPRHEFVPELYRPHSYENRPLPIGQSQTISQPYIVAYMVQELGLTEHDTILEIGTGSGYHAAVMSLVCKFVYTIEILPELGQGSIETFERLRYDNIQVRIGDGYQGWAEHAPFDAVILTAAPSKIPQPLLDQLKVGGRFIAPVGVDLQELVLITRTETGYSHKKLIPVRFVPMTGEAQKE